MRKLNISKIFLKKEYIKNKKTITDISEDLKCSSSVIWKYLKKYNIRIRKRIEYMKNYSKILTKKYLIQEYTKNQKSTTQIAEETIFSASLIYSKLKKYKIKIRTVGEASQNRFSYFKILTKSFLIKEYIINNKSADKIAKQVECSTDSIYNYLKKHNIKIRKLQNKNNPSYIDGRCSKKYYCKDCGTNISLTTGIYGEGRCWNCSMIYLVKTGKRQGSNNSNWKNGKSIEPYPLGWTTLIREQIRIRDNYTCQICGKTQKKNKRKLSVHHIDYNKNNLTPENLISLCCICHGQTNNIKNKIIYIEYFKILIVL